MTKQRGVSYALVLVMLIVGWFGQRGCNKRHDQRVQSPVLPTDDQQKIIIDPKHHKIVNVTPGKTETIFLPPHPTAIDIRKGGDVVFDSRVWGTELEPMFGLAYGDKARVAIGVSFYYFRSFELSGLLLPSVSSGWSVRAGLAVGYNAYSNTHLFVGVDNKLSPIGGIAFNF